MGASGGPLSSVITYDVADRRGEGRPRRVEPRSHEESIFDYLSREMQRLRYLSDDLPFDFNCGFVGYFGYELKADCEGDARASSPSMPDAAFVFADRLIAFDHYEKCDLPPLRHRADQRGRGPSAGSRETGRAPRRRCRRSSRSSSATRRRARRPSSASAARTSSTSTTSGACKDYLIEGESYEVCLTNKVAHRRRARPAAALPHAAPRQPGAVLGLPALRRRGGPELLAGALPARRPRPLGRGQADQGHLPAAATTAPRTCAWPRSCAPTRRTAPRT